MHKKIILLTTQHGYLELNLDPLQKQYMLLTYETPLAINLKNVNNNKGWEIAQFMYCLLYKNDLYFNPYVK